MRINQTNAKLFSLAAHLNLRVYQKLFDPKKEEKVNQNISLSGQT